MKEYRETEYSKTTLLAFKNYTHPSPNRLFSCNLLNKPCWDPTSLGTARSFANM